MKFLAGGGILAAAAAYVAFLGASANWQYYLLVDECCAQLEKWNGERLRLAGKVSPGSLRIAADRRSATFDIVGTSHSLAVACRGPLPDNLAEGMEVVVEGKLLDGARLQGDRVITRCASKYAARDNSP